MEFNTVAISDGITMGTEGMKTSLVSREVIADSIELMGRGHMFDAMVVLVGCDKTIPGGTMALLRLDVPGVVLYGGSIQPGVFRGKQVTVLNLFEAVGAHAAKKITDEDLHELEGAACPGPGACGGQFTANTMAMALEFMGLSAHGLRQRRGDGRREGRRRRRRGEARDGSPPARRPPARDRHARRRSRTRSRA
jgi:dihydroxy-acid dehydratase